LPEGPESTDCNRRDGAQFARSANRRSRGDAPRGPSGWCPVGEHDGQLERARRELERAACGTVLDLLALALIDGEDVDAIIEASIRANRARRRIALPSEWPSVAADGVRPGGYATDRPGAATTLAQSLLRAAEREFVAKRT